MNLNKACTEAVKIARARQLKENTVQTLKHCAGEIVEATEAYMALQSVVWAETSTQEMITRAGHDFAIELADVIMCILSICGAEYIDIERALDECFQKNKARVKK